MWLKDNSVHRKGAKSAKKILNVSVQSIRLNQQRMSFFYFVSLCEELGFSLRSLRLCGENLFA